MIVALFACDVCGKDGKHRSTTNLTPDQVAAAVPLGDFYVITAREPSGWERGHREREIIWHLCSHACLARWHAEQAQAYAAAVPPIATGEPR